MTEDDLDADRRRLAVALEAANGAVYEYSVPEGRVTYFSEHWGEILGCRSGKLSQEPWLLDWLSQRVHPDDRAAWNESRRESSLLDVRLRHEDGDWISMRGLTKALDRDSDRRPTRVLGALFKVSDPEGGDTTPVRREHDDVSWVENFPDVVFRLDRNLRHLYISPAVERYIGMRPEAFLGKTGREAGLPESLWRPFAERCRRLIRDGKTASFEFAASVKNETRFLESRLFPERGPEGRVRSILGVTTDLTERKGMEKALRELNESLEARVVERTAQLERKTRQLRLLANELTDAEQHTRKQLGQALHDGLQQMLIAAKMQLSTVAGGTAGSLVTVEQLLDECLAASRSLAYELSPPALYNSELPQALRWLARWFSEKHRLHVDLDVAADFPALTDNLKVFLFNAIRELLLNCVKHSGAQEAVLRMQRLDDGRIEAVVSDRGRGFDPAALDTDGVFRGLGLVSIRERVEALEGVLDVDSAPGAGARFVLRLPGPERSLRSTEDGSPSDEKPAAPSPVRVLIADDHRIVREGLVSMLQRQGEIEFVGEAADGAEAVEQADRLAPDVIVMDVNMPRVDGIESTRRIKAKHPEIQIIGLSLHEDEENAEAMLRAGASAYLPKAGAVKTLFQTILRLSAT